MILSRMEIEDYAEALLRHFGADEARFLDIVRFVTDFLGLNIVCRRLSVDGDVLGVTTYADTQIVMPDWGDVRPVNVPKDTILVCTSITPEDRYDRGTKYGRFRFTIAHEGAHQILYRAEPDERQRSLRQLESRPYSMRELKSCDDWCEWQANALAASLLMPRHKVLRLTQGRRFTLYGKRMNSLDKFRFYKLQAAFGVSKAALRLRLKEIGLLEQRSEYEYYDPLEVWNDEADEDTDITHARGA